MSNPSPHSLKPYACKRCGHVKEQMTNHYGDTYSWGRYNCCPACPPWAKFPEFGGATVWVCQAENPRRQKPALN